MSQKKPRSLMAFRLLAFAHGIVGLVPLLYNVLLGGFLGGGGWWLPAGGIGVVGGLIIAVQVLLPVAWAAWLLMLAIRLWHPTPPLAGPLRWTHGFVLLLGGLYCAGGFYAIRVAERSVAAGGGLLSPVAVIPLLIGVPLVILALGSLLAAWRIEREC